MRGSQYSSSQAIIYCTSDVWAIESSLSTSKHDKCNAAEICKSLEPECNVFTTFTVLLATRTCVLMSNLLVVVSTWQATRTNRAANMRNSKGSLTTTLIRDGIVHFALVVGINIADITSALLTGELFDFSAPVEFISTMVLCRFFLNLRQFSANSDVNDSTGSSPGSSFLRFASGIIGNLGEMLEEGSHALDDDLDCELDNPSDAEEFDITGSNAHSDGRSITQVGDSRGHRSAQTV